MAQMSFAEFEAAMTDAAPPKDATPALQALWHDRNGDWSRAHELVQNDRGRDAAWVHAYLHRKEGDEGNAGYWYARAGRPRAPSHTPLEEEWAEVARALLGE
jgi:hypothetical protein